MDCEVPWLLCVPPHFPILVTTLAMTPLLLFIPLLHVAVGQPASRTVHGYKGDIVTLSTGTDPSQNLSTVTWSVLSNETWIATLKAGEVKTNHFWRYQGRLDLNVNSGDLAIKELTTRDAMRYEVELRYSDGRWLKSNIDLVVNQHLSKPSARSLFSALTNRSCIVALKCSSPDEDVVFTWREEQSSSTHSSSVLTTTEDNHIIIASIRLKSEVTFTCTAQGPMETASSSVAVPCYAPALPSGPDEKPTSLVMSKFTCGVLGFLAGALLAALVVYMYSAKGGAAVKHLKDRLCCPKCTFDPPTARY